MELENGLTARDQIRDAIDAREMNSFFDALNV